MNIVIRILAVLRIIERCDTCFGAYHFKGERE